MRAIICLLAILVASFPLTARTPVVTLSNLTTEYKTDPIGLETTHPRFSWKLNTPATDVTQLAY